jgi:PTS system mannose-specific IIA component
MSLLRVLVVTHGELGRALVEAALLVAGPREGVAALSNTGLSREGLVEAVLAHMAALPAEDSLLLLVDAPGASPHVACRLALARQREERRTRLLGPVTGVNLPLLLTLLNRRETTTPADLLPLLLDRGRAGIQLSE